MESFHAQFLKKELFGVVKELEAKEPRSASSALSAPSAVPSANQETTAYVLRHQTAL
ncbi:MAG: hypothetical protein ACI4NU_02390 [Christensenellales bacterium]